MEIFNDSLDFNENKLLFSIEINLSNKKTQKINIFSNSNPNKIAYDFSILLSRWTQLSYINNEFN
jgi:hypothetical protein